MMDFNSIPEMVKFICDKLDKQGEKCADESGNCLYRDGKGNKCAVGHIILDSEYSSALEGEAVDYLYIPYPAIPNAKDRDVLDTLKMLQRVHDNWVDGKFSERLKRIVTVHDPILSRIMYGEA